jgi:hypothetical protein
MLTPPLTAQPLGNPLFTCETCAEQFKSLRAKKRHMGATAIDDDGNIVNKCGRSKQDEVRSETVCIYPLLFTSILSDYFLKRAWWGVKCFMLTIIYCASNSNKLGAAIFLLESEFTTHPAAQAPGHNRLLLLLHSVLACLPSLVCLV